MKKFNTRVMVITGLLVAMQVVLSRFLSINAWDIKIGFAFVPVFVAAYLFGPMGGAIVGALGDFVGAVLFPIGPYFPGFTLSTALTGVVMGVLLHKKQSVSRIATAVVINQVAISLFLNTLWISMLYGSPYGVLLSARLVQICVLAPIEFITIGVLIKTAPALSHKYAA